MQSRDPATVLIATANCENAINARSIKDLVYRFTNGEPTLPNQRFSSKSLCLFAPINRTYIKLYRREEIEIR